MGLIEIMYDKVSEVTRKSIKCKEALVALKTNF